MSTDHVLSSYRYSDADKQQWVDWYVKKKWTVAQICDKTGATRHTVTRWLKRGGVDLRGNPRHFDRKSILRDIRIGKLSQTAIAKKHSCSQRLVSELASGKLLP